MHVTCLAIIDTTRARLFTYVRHADADGVHDALSEDADLVNPARRRTPAQLFSDTRTNTRRVGRKYFGVDDHRSAHLAELDAEFAWEITAAIERAIRNTGATRLILCAPPRMLGTLRAMDLRRDGLVVDELPRDYAKLTRSQLHDVLAQQGLLPGRAREMHAAAATR